MMLLEDTHATIKACCDCELGLACKQPVPGDGPAAARLFLIGEAPGYNEDVKGIPFTGQAGGELERYLLRAGLPLREDIYISNTVKCRPPENRDPEWSEIHECWKHLKAELEIVKPKVIGLLGAWAARALISPDFNLAALHGIPLRVKFSWGNAVVVACGHPALGLHSPKAIVQIEEDFEALAAAYRGTAKALEYPFPPADKSKYFHLQGYAEDIFKKLYDDWKRLKHPPFLSIDTETEGSEPWSLQFCMGDGVNNGDSYLIMADDLHTLEGFAEFVKFFIDDGSPDNRIILHHGQFDLRILKKMGIRIPVRKCEDSMIAAYVLQNQPQKLKLLALRHAQMKLTPYANLVHEATQAKAIKYLEAALAAAPYPDPDPYEEFTVKQPAKKKARVKKDGTIVPAPPPPPKNRRGEWKIVLPTNVEGKLKKLLEKARTNPDCDVWEDWHNKDVRGGRGQVEEKFGPMQPAWLSEIPFETALNYACADADATLRVWPTLKRLVEEAGLWRAYQLDLHSLPAIMEMESVGMRVNPDKLDELLAWFEVELRRLWNRCAELAGYEFNPNSKDQVGYLLYYKLKLPIPKPRGKKKTEESTVDDLIRPYADKYPVVGAILDYRECLKAMTSYAESFRAAIKSDLRIHPNIMTTRTDTGRRATKNPNILSTPKHSERGLGKMIRACFIADTGNSLMEIDYSQIELRLLAHMSADPVMRQIYIDGKIDLHTNTASMIKADLEGITMEEAYPLVESGERFNAKPINFGLPYGLTPQGLQTKLKALGVDVSLGEVEKWIDAVMGGYKGVAAWLKGVVNEGLRYGFVRNWAGRFRRIGELHSSDKSVRAEGERFCANAPIQSGAVDVMKSAEAGVMEICDYYRDMGYVCDPWLDFHDALIFEVSDEILENFAADMAAWMESVCQAEFSVPILVDVSVGKSWDKMEKFKFAKAA